MQKQKKPIQEVSKPVLNGSWHGRDAWKKGCKMMLSVLFVTFIYLLLSLMLSFNSVWARALTGGLLVAAAAVYLYYNGMSVGQEDAAYGEILYERQQEGKDINGRERSFHPAKGFFEAAVGALPFFVIALVFACITQPEEYALGALPSWLKSYNRQSEFGDALAYYSVNNSVSVLTVLRVAVRAMTMPMMNVAVALGSGATLLAERLAPLFVLIAPLGYGFGYMQGKKIRTKIHTGIAIGDDKKKRKERKERKARAKTRGNKPEQLI